MIEELKARIAELKRQQAVLVEALNHTAQYIAWREFGECRGFDAAIATPAQVIEIALAALAAVNLAAVKPAKTTPIDYDMLGNPPLPRQSSRIARMWSVLRLAHA